MSGDIDEWGKYLFARSCKFVMTGSPCNRSCKFMIIDAQCGKRDNRKIPNNKYSNIHHNHARCGELATNSIEGRILKEYHM